MKQGENIWSLCTESHANGMPACNGVWPGSPVGSFMTLLLLPQCHAAFSMIRSTLAWVDQSPVSQCLVPGCPLYNCYCLPCGPGYGSPRNLQVRTRGWIYGRPACGFPLAKVVTLFYIILLQPPCSLFHRACWFTRIINGKLNAGPLKIWFTAQWVPHLDLGSIIIIDNASICLVLIAKILHANLKSLT